MKRRLYERIEIGDEVYSPRDEYYVTVLDIKGDRVLADGPMGKEYHNLSDLEKKVDYESEDLYEGRKKVIRLTESDLVRLVKRVIKEEMKCDAYCVWKKLRSHYEPKGFKYSTDPDGNEMLTKGKDPNASYVQFYHFDTKNSPNLRGVFRYGKPGVNGKVSGDHRVVDKVYSTITSKI